MKLRGEIEAILFLLLAGMFIPANSVFAQEFLVDFEEQLVLGDDEDAPIEYLFGGVRELDTDSQGRIYIADSNNDIRVFSPEGEYLTTFGGQGSGPGEFLEIGAMAVSDDGEVVVYDRKSFRITFFYNLGDSVVTYSYDNWKIRQGRQTPQSNIVPLADGRYAITSKMQDPGYERQPGEFDNRVVHIVPPDFSEFEHSMFDVYKEELFNPNELLARKMARDSDYKLKKLPGGRLVLTHEIYDGFLYILDFNSNSDGIQKTEGAFAGLDRYEILQGETMDFVEEGYKNLVSGGGTLGRFIYQKKLSSEGLFANDRWIINIVSIADAAEISFYMEFFDANDGSYKGYTSIDDDFNTHIPDEVRQLFRPHHLDNQNQLYYVDYSNDALVIRVTKLEIEE